MRLFRMSLSLLPLLGMLWWPGAAHGDDEGKYVGAYYSHVNNGGKEGGYLNLSLGYDRTATVTEAPFAGGTHTLFGRWAVNGNGVTITFTPHDGQPAEPPMSFTNGHDGLQAVAWNHAVWGKTTPPPVKKGGAKVKEHYWLSSNP